MNSYYEHHTTLKQDKLCPFKVEQEKSMTSGLCNWHKNIEILLVTGGHGTIQLEKDTFPMEQGDLIVINSGILHCPSSKTGVGFYVVIIDADFCKENGLDIGSICFHSRFQDEETQRLLLRMIEATRSYRTDPQPLTVIAARAAALQLLSDLVSRHCASTSGKEESISPAGEYVKRVLGYLNENYTSPIQLEHLAGLCGITKYYLAREFKRLTGQTVFTYANMLRCKKAQMLLAQGKSVTESALESGFESLPYFSRTYKKLMGTSPSKAKPLIR